MLVLGVLAWAGQRAAAEIGLPPLLDPITGSDAQPQVIEDRFVRYINEDRTAAGLPALQVDAQLVRVARNHSGTMAPTGSIFHNVNLGRQVTGAWRLLGENVGVGSDVESLHKAFINSPKHRDNILGPFDYVGIGVVVASSEIYVTELFSNTGKVSLAQAPAIPPAPPVPTNVGITPTRSGRGYWTVASNGGVSTIGDAASLGSMEGVRLNRPVVGMAATPTGKGYWLVASDGGIFTFGDAGFLGSMGAVKLYRPVIGMAATPTGKGYWLVASDGGVFTFGDARFLGSTGGVRLTRPVVGMAATPTGKGYWLVDSGGGTFRFGDAKSLGSTAGMKLHRPVVGMAATPTGNGYWLVASDGGVFTFGDAGFLGSMGGEPLNRPVVGMAATPTGKGYWLVDSDWETYSFGDASE